MCAWYFGLVHVFSVKNICTDLTGFNTSSTLKNLRHSIVSIKTGFEVN